MKKAKKNPIKSAVKAVRVGAEPKSKPKSKRKSDKANLSVDGPRLNNDDDIEMKSAKIIVETDEICSVCRDPGEVFLGIVCCCAVQDLHRRDAFCVTFCGLLS